MALYRHIPLERLAMTRAEVEAFVVNLNAETEAPFLPAVITRDDELAIDTRLARRLAVR